MKRLLILIFLLFGDLSLFSQPKIIFDTDIGSDADDLGALAMLHTFIKRGDCELLAVMNWSLEENAVSAIDAVNRYYLHPNIQIGTRKGQTFKDEANYNRVIAENFSFKLSFDDVPDATELYRKILSTARDTSITIITVGPLANIENLIKSGSDNYSSLNGAELISKKVKEFVIMGGQFPKGKDEWNFNGDMPGVTKFVLENLKAPITFTGFELGSQIKTGEIFNNIDPETPLYKGFLYYSGHAPWMKDNFKGKILSNSSFDQTAVLYAVKSGVGAYWDKVDGGFCEADETGGNKWVRRKNSNQAYLKLKESPEVMSTLIEVLMLDKVDEFIEMEEE